jgi:hypothetical protein
MRVSSGVSGIATGGASAASPIGGGAFASGGDRDSGGAAAEFKCADGIRAGASMNSVRSVAAIGSAGRAAGRSISSGAGSSDGAAASTEPFIRRRLATLFPASWCTSLNYSSSIPAARKPNQTYHSTLYFAETPKTLLAR